MRDQDRCRLPKEMQPYLPFEQEPAPMTIGTDRNTNALVHTFALCLLSTTDNRDH